MKEGRRNSRHEKGMLFLSLRPFIPGCETSSPGKNWSRWSWEEDRNQNPLVARPPLTLTDLTPLDGPHSACLPNPGRFRKKPRLVAPWRLAVGTSGSGALFGTRPRRRQIFNVRSQRRGPSSKICLRLSIQLDSLPPHDDGTPVCDRPLPPIAFRRGIIVVDKRRRWAIGRPTRHDNPNDGSPAQPTFAFHLRTAPSRGALVEQRTTAGLVEE